jgi:hypothetical protein
MMENPQDNQPEWDVELLTRLLNYPPEEVIAVMLSSIGSAIDIMEIQLNFLSNDPNFKSMKLAQTGLQANASDISKNIQANVDDIKKMLYVARDYLVKTSETE